jgi:hypothetical protein
MTHSLTRFLIGLTYFKLKHVTKLGAIFEILKFRQKEQNNISKFSKFFSIISSPSHLSGHYPA